MIPTSVIVGVAIGALLADLVLSAFLKVVKR